MKIIKNWLIKKEKKVIEKKIAFLMEKTNEYQELDVQMFKNLLSQCDVNFISKNGWNPIIYTIIHNVDKGIYINTNHFYELLKKSNLNLIDPYGYTMMMYILRHNYSHEIHLTSDQLFHLLQKCDLNQKDYGQWTILDTLFLMYNEQKLSLNKEQIFHLIQKAGLYLQNEKNIINYFKFQQIEFDEEKIKYLFQKCSTEGKQQICKTIIKFYKNNEKYIDCFLYDCSMPILESTKEWLNKNQYYNILTSFEKRGNIIENYKNLKKQLIAPIQIEKRMKI
jgi:hypothetical protein